MSPLLFVALLVTRATIGVGPARDIDGDGFDDVSFGYQLAYGSPARPMAATRSPHRPAGGGWMFGSVVVAGDVDGDGHADVVVGDPGCPDFALSMPRCGVGSIHLFLGGSRTFSAAPAQTISIPGDNTMFGGQVIALGDVDGDHRDDIAVAAHDGIRVFLGTASGLSTTAIQLPGSQAYAAGDLDGDGRADLVTLLGGAMTIYYGADAKRSATVALPDAEPSARFYAGLGLGHGDFDGDGFGDLAVAVAIPTSGRERPHVVFVYRGSRAGLSPTPSVHFTRDHARAELGTFGSVGDLDGDGRDDLVVIAECSKYRAAASSCEGRTAYVYLGGARGLSTTPVASLAPARATAESAGYEFVPLGDIDHDGHADFAFEGQVYRGVPGGVAKLRAKAK